MPWISSHANSPTIFVTAYGEVGAGRMDSTFGISGESPYTAALETKTTRRTAASAAALRTWTRPSTVGRRYSSGFATLSWTGVFAQTWSTIARPFVAAARGPARRIDGVARWPVP